MEDDDDFKGLEKFEPSKRKPFFPSGENGKTEELKLFLPSGEDGAIEECDFFCQARQSSRAYNWAYSLYDVVTNYPLSVVGNLYSVFPSNNYQQFQDERWKLPEYRKYMDMASTVSNEKEEAEMWDYIINTEALMKNVAERGNVALDLLSGIIVPENAFFLLRPLRFFHGESLTANLLNVSSSSAFATTAHMSLMAPMKAQLSDSEVAIAVGANIILDNLIQWSVGGLVSAYRYYRARIGRGQGKSPSSKPDGGEVDYKSLGVSEPLPSRSVPARDLYEPSVTALSETGVKNIKDRSVGSKGEVKVSSELANLREKLGDKRVIYTLPTMSKEVFESLQPFPNARMPDGSLDVNMPLFSSKKEENEWIKNQILGRPDDFYSMTAEKYIAENGVGSLGEYFSRSFEPIFDIPYESNLPPKKIDSRVIAFDDENFINPNENAQGTQLMIAEKVAVDSLSKEDRVTPKEREDILTSEKGKKIVMDVMTDIPFNFSLFHPLGELRRRYVADSIREVLGISSDQTIPVYFDAKTGKSFFNADAKPVDLAYTVKALGKGRFKISSNDGALDGLEYSPPSLLWSHDIVTAEDIAYMPEFSVLYPEFRTLFEGVGGGGGGDGGGGGEVTSGSPEYNRQRRSELLGDDGYVTQDFTRLGGAGRIGLGNFERDGFVDRFFTGVTRLADFTVNFSGGSFLLNGLTSSSNFVQNFTSLLFQHNFILESMERTGKPIRRPAGSRILADRRDADILISEAKRAYYAIVERKRLSGEIESSGFSDGVFSQIKATSTDVREYLSTAVNKATGGASSPATQYHGTEQDNDYTLAEFSTSIFKRVVGADDAVVYLDDFVVSSSFDNIPDAYKELVSEVARKISGGHKIRGKLQNKVNIGTDAVALLTDYMQRSWNADSVNTESSFNALVNMIEVQTRKHADDVLKEIEKNVNALKGEVGELLEQVANTPSRYIKKIALNKIVSLEKKIKGLGHESVYYKDVAQIPNEMGVSKAKDIALSQAMRVRDGKTLHDGIPEGIDSLLFDSKGDVVKSSSQREATIKGDTKHYIRWVFTDAFNGYKRSVYTSGAVLRTLEVFQEAGFADLKEVVEGLDSERAVKIANLRTELKGDSLVKAKMKVNNAYEEHKKFVIGATAHILDRYKDTFGLLNDIARGSIAYASATTLNLTPLGIASDLMKVGTDVGLLHYAEGLLSGFKRRIKNLKTSYLKRVDPDGVYITTYIIDQEVQVPREIRRSIGVENTFADSTDSAVTSWLMKMATEVSKLSGIEVLNRFAQSLSAKLTMSFVMVMADKVGRGVKLSKLEDSRRLELGLRIEDLYEFYNSWQSVGGKRIKERTWWTEKSIPDAMPHLWTDSSQKRFFHAISTGVAHGVFNDDKGIHSRFFSKSNVHSLIGVFTSFLSHENTKIFVPTVVAMAKGDYGKVFRLALMLGISGYIYEELSNAWQRNPFIQGDNMPLRKDKSPVDIALGTLDRSGLIGGLYAIIAFLYASYQAYDEKKKLDISSVKQKIIGIPLNKVVDGVENIPLAFYGDNAKDKSKGYRSALAFFPLNGGYMKPLQSSLIDWLLDGFGEENEEDEKDFATRTKKPKKKGKRNVKEKKNKQEG